MSLVRMMEEDSDVSESGGEKVVSHFISSYVLDLLRISMLSLRNHILLKLIKLQMPSKKESKKEPYASKASSSKKKPKDGDEDGSKKRKQKKKKDPNAPKRAV